MTDDPTPESLTALPLDLLRQVEHFCQRFEAGWRGGDPPSLETCLSDAPAAIRPALLRELLPLEVEYRRRRGETPSADEYISRFPDQTERILAAWPGPSLVQILGEDTYREDAVVEAPLAPGTEVGRFRIRAEIARGGMGAVFRAYDPDFDRDLAVKVLLSGHRAKPESVRRFLAEVRIAGRLEHPGLVPVHAAGQLVDGRPFFAMKLIEGQTFSALLKARRTLADDRARFVHVFEQVCQTLAYVHSRGVVHRDLKPSNVMVGAFGEVQVMDWGLAKELGERDSARAASEVLDSRSESIAPPLRAGETAITEAGAVIGTPAFMAPEQARGERERIDARTDVFGLGAILGQILTGAPPYADADPMVAYRRAFEGDLADALGRLDRCGADPELVRLAKRCLAVDPADRPADADAVAQAVTAYRRGVEERLRAVELSEERRKRQRLGLALAATVLLAVGVGAVAAQAKRNDHLRQTAAANRAVELALAEAIELRGRADRDSEARLKLRDAARHAATLVEGGLVDPALTQRVRALGEDVEAEDRDRRMVAALDAARLRGAEVDVARNKMHGADIGELVAALRIWDVVAGETEPTKAAEWLKSRPEPVRREVVATLDEWFLRRPDSTEWTLAVLTAYDPDPWRVKLRRAHRDGDGPTLLTMLDPTDLARQPREAIRLLAEALRGAGQPLHALAVYRLAHLHNPDDFWLALQLGHLSSERNLYEDAAKYHTVCLALRPGNVGVLVSLSACLQHIGRNPEALAAIEAAIRRAPTYAQAHANRAAILAKMRRYDAAIAAAHEAIRLEPNLPYAYTSLGIAYHFQKKWPEAESAYQEALTRDPGFLLALDMLGAVLFEQRRFEESADAYRRISRLDPNMAGAYFGLGRALLGMGAKAEAEAAFRECLKRDPAYKAAQTELAKMRGN